MGECVRQCVRGEIFMRCGDDLFFVVLVIDSCSGSRESRKQK